MKLPCPVVCVGNLTTGGTGKTPVVIAVTRIITNMDNPPPIPPLKKGGEGGFKVAILSRGYKRKSKTPVLLVCDGTSILTTPDKSGDEPYLIASSLKNTPVIVGADRYKSGIYASTHMDTDVFILDDGYQHLRLYRDINILLIDASNPYGNGHLLPEGILREPLSGISRADCVIVTRANEASVNHLESLVREHNPDAPIFYATLRSADITDFNGNTYNINTIKDKKTFIFSGIANPQSFKKSVEYAGGRIVGELSYPDHYWYKSDDVIKIMDAAAAVSADAVITTAKDAVRLHGLDLCVKTVPGINLFKLNVEMVIDNRFSEWIQIRLSR